MPLGRCNDSTDLELFFEMHFWNQSESMWIISDKNHYSNDYFSLLQFHVFTVERTQKSAKFIQKLHI